MKRDLGDGSELDDGRAQGLGIELARFSVEEVRLRCGWMLHTADAHGLYAKVGFEAPTSRVMERRRR